MELVVILVLGLAQIWCDAPSMQSSDSRWRMTNVGVQGRAAMLPTSND